MTGTPKFAHVDTRKPDGFYVQFATLLEDDPLPWDGDTPAPRHILGVRVEARCMIVRNGTGTLMNLQSPGLYGVGVDRLSDPYLNEVAEEQKAELLAIIAAMRNPIIEG